MNILEMKEKVLNLREELQGIINNGEKECRELAENENSRMAEIRTEIDTLNEQIEQEEKNDRQLNKENKTENTKMGKEVRLYNLIKKVSLGEQLSDEERQYVNGSKISYRDIVAQGAAGTGIENIPEDKKSLDVAVRNNTILTKMGATWFGNAKGDISIPRYSGSMCAWADEVAEAASGDGVFTEVLLQPRRLTAYLNVSKTFLAQSSSDTEGILINDLANAVVEKFESTIFGTDSGTTNRPAGLFAADADYLITGGTLANITYNDVLDIELATEEKNGHNFVFVASPQVRYALKGTQTASGLQMVYNNGEIDGYPAIISNSVAKGGVICMEARDLAVATWGYDITVDPYTRAAFNEVRLVINFLCDAKLRGDRISAAIFE